MKLTAGMLASLGIAPWDIAKFRALFGESCDITPEACRRAENVGLRVKTLLALVLTKEEYDRATVSNLDEQMAEERRIAADAQRLIKESKERFAQAELQRHCDAVIVGLRRLYSEQPTSETTP